jgi:hypothetical protein
MMMMKITIRVSDDELVTVVGDDNEDDCQYVL